MRYYAGIGSRNTPDHIKKIMHDIAVVLATTGDWTLRSGAAAGADTAFEVGALDHNGPVEIYLPWENFNNHKSDLHPNNYPFTQSEMDFAESMHPAWHKCGAAARLLHSRNIRQLIGLNAIHGDEVKVSSMVVCWTENGKLKGGTAQAIRYANKLSVPVINLGQAQNHNELMTMINMIEQIHENKG